MTPYDMHCPNGLSVLAEYQRELIVANTVDGLAAACAHGRNGGRLPKLTDQRGPLAQQIYDSGQPTMTQIGNLLGVRRSTIYGYLRPTAA